MTFYFYTNSADNRKVDKSNDITQLGTSKSVILKNNEDRGEMTLELAYDSTLMTANYAYCSDNGYYYYLAEPVMSQQRLFFKASTDLLMTYRSEIDDLGCIIARQENSYNAYLNDDRYPVLAKQRVTSIPFPDGFSSGEEMLLVVNGQ